VLQPKSQWNWQASSLFDSVFDSHIWGYNSKYGNNVNLWESCRFIGLITFKIPFAAPAGLHAEAPRSSGFPPFVARRRNANLESTFTCGGFDARESTQRIT